MRPSKLRDEEHQETAAPRSQRGRRVEGKGAVWPPPDTGTGADTCPRGPGRPFIFELEELFGITKWLAHTRPPLRATYTTGP